MRNVPKYAAVLATCGIVLTSCGGGGGSPAGSTPVTTPAPTRTVLRYMNNSGDSQVIPISFTTRPGAVGWVVRIEQPGTLDAWFQINPGPPGAWASLQVSHDEKVLVTADAPGVDRQQLVLNITVPGEYLVEVFKPASPSATDGFGEIGFTPAR